MPDPSRSADRTQLSWQRTVLAATLLSLVPLHDLGRTVGVPGLVAVAALAVLTAVLARQRLPLLAVVVVGLDCTLALATALTPGGTR
ncbi:DUF202 domain-containing protein [Nocardioides sp. LML1-1-1.1]|uniref:DUF202 domain-containing protein n=1 Tax=Nocardioides sp. LML1-1-1.1 TaxID=3135248 RepID=UPI00341CECE8